MIWKKTVIMSSAFIVSLGAFLIARLATSGGEGPAFEMPEFTEASISKIEVTGGENPVTLEKRESGWVVLPGEHAADQRALERLTKSIAELEVGSLRSDNPDKFALYEVADDDLEVTLTTGSGPGFSFFLGKETGDRRGEYIRRAGDDEVFAAKGRLRMQLDKELKNWRDKTVLTFDMPAAERLVLTRGGRSLTFSKGEDGWAFADIPADLPEAFRLDERKASEIVRTMSTLRAADFVDDAGDLSKLGLDPAVIEVTAFIGKAGEEGAEKSFAKKTLLVGNQQGEQVYAKDAENAQVYLLNKYHYDKFARTLDDFRDLRVNPFEGRDAKRIETRVGQRETVFVFDDARKEWTLESTTEDKPAGFKLDAVKIRQLATMIGNFQGAKFVGTKALRKHGFGSPSGTVTVTLGDGKAHTLSIGSPVGDDEVYMTGDDGLVYTASMNTAENLTRTLDSYQVSSARSEPSFSPEMLKNLPPDVRQQLLQQQRQKLFQQQMMDQMMKQRERQEKKKEEAPEAPKP